MEMSDSLRLDEAIFEYLTIRDLMLRIQPDSDELGTKASQWKGEIAEVRFISREVIFVKDTSDSR